MTFLRVKNWERFQHYKQRNPPWIRLYNELLDDYEFSCLQDASKWHAVGLWLLASRFDNRIPNDAAWIGQRINARSRVDIPELLKSGFIETYEDASNTLAECTQHAKPETEAETEKSRDITETDLGAKSAEPSEPKKVRKRKPGLWRTVPADWQPTDAHRALAAELGVDMALQAELYREHEFARPKSDADRAFSQWLRRAREYADQRPTKVPATSEAGRVRRELPQSNGNRTGRPVRLDGHDPEAEKLKRERAEDAAVLEWQTVHAAEAKTIAEGIAEEMRTDLRWRGTPQRIVDGVARGLYRTRVLARISENGNAAVPA